MFIYAYIFINFNKLYCLVGGSSPHNMCMGGLSDTIDNKIYVWMDSLITTYEVLYLEYTTSVSPTNFTSITVLSTILELNRFFVHNKRFTPTWQMYRNSYHINFLQNKNQQKQQKNISTDKKRRCNQCCWSLPLWYQLKQKRSRP